jgi:hypothetical protein
VPGILHTPRVHNRQVPEKFKVAFSFAGEQRELVRSIAEAVEGEVGQSNVYYDEWFEYYIAGDDADLRLQDIYGNRCLLVVVCLSQRYGEKPWTRAEHAAIRARQMQARVSGDTLSILPIRVGDGEVEGLLFNTIAPDVREKSVTEAARMVLDRLRMIDQPVPVAAASNDDWPEIAPPLRWPMADHSEVRAAFEQFVTRGSEWRILLVRGPSETGKSHITRQMLGNALRVSDLACGRFDFKGTTDMDVELRSFVQQLDVPLPAAGQRLTERLGHLLDTLKQRRRPALLIFDTYEQTGEAQDWMEKQLLPTAIRAPWIRIVVTGQRVPERAGAIWESDARPLITLKPPLPADWLDYGRMHNPDITLEQVKTLCDFAADKAPLLQQLLGPRP